MDIKTEVDGDNAVFTLNGKLTVQTSPELNSAVDALPGSIRNIDIDMTNVTYVASAGLRVLVAIDKLVVSRSGTMRLLHPCQDVMDVLDMTGLNQIFTVEK